MNPARTAGDRLVQRTTGKLASLCKTFASGFDASLAIAAFGVLLVGLFWGTVFLQSPHREGGGNTDRHQRHRQSRARVTRGESRTLV